MNIYSASMFWLALVAIVSLIVMITLIRKPNKPSTLQAIEALKQDVDNPETIHPNRIVVGENPHQPVVTIEALSSTDQYDLAQPLDSLSESSINRLSALCQAIPSLLVAGEASGKRLMEVVINGDLVRASDGNGLRAFATGAKGIKENARLFEVDNLQNMVNAAAIWQIASVVVAQKHLADISRKLDEIKSGVFRVSKFLDNQRKSRISAAYSYLGQVHQGIQDGSLPISIRHQLESCELDLLEIQHHLEIEYRQIVDKEISHKEMFGTKDLTNGITNKMNELDLIAEDIALCMKTRIIAWHVLSLFPGEPQLKYARLASIQDSIETLATLAPYCEEGMKRDISAVKAFWNTEDTLTSRKKSLTNKCDFTVLTLSNMTQQGLQLVKRSEQLMLDSDRPTRLFLEFENGALVGTRKAV